MKHTILMTLDDWSKIKQKGGVKLHLQGCDIMIEVINQKDDEVTE